MRWEGHPHKRTCRPKRAFPLRKCPFGQSGEMRNDISASSRALYMYRVGRGESGEVPPLNDVCTSLFVIPKVFVTEGPVAIVSVQETDIDSIFGSVSLLNTPNADSKLHPFPHPPYLWSCEYKLIASLNLATASAYCSDNANRLASAGGSRGQGTRKLRTRSHCQWQHKGAVTHLPTFYSPSHLPLSSLPAVEARPKQTA